MAAMAKKLLAAAFAVLLLAACNRVEPVVPAGGDDIQDTQSTASSTTTTTTTTTTTAPEIPEPSVVRFICAGDNLIHSSLFNQAKRYAEANDKEGYDPSYQYALVEKYIALGDISVLNQESPLCGDVYPPSNYPNFSTPTDYGRHMLKIGFDVFSVANNHILDQGEGGVLAALDYWDSEPDATVVGAYRDEADLNDIRMLEKNGITFSFLAFTFSTNGLVLPEGSPVQIVYTWDAQRMADQITRARAVSDVVVVNVHWGEEGSTTPTAGQRALAQQFADWGADIILGTHPHVLQPIELLQAADGREVLCFYSMANFISSMNTAESMAGGIFDFTVTREYDADGEAGPIAFSDIHVMPIVTHYGENVSNVRIIPFKDYTPELANAHGLISYWDIPYNYDIPKNLFDTVITDTYLVDELE